SRRGYGLGRNLEGQLRNDDSAQWMPWDVHTFPEGVRAQQDAAAGRHESFHELGSRRLTVDEERPMFIAATEFIRELPQRTVRCKKYEDPAIGYPGQLLNDVTRGLGMPLIIRSPGKR